MEAVLRQLSVGDDMDIYDMLQEIPHDENGFVNGVCGKSYEEFKQWLVRGDGIAKGIGLEDWQVPQSTYWLYVDGRPVGYGKLRHRLTEKLKKEGGHIGYAIRPSVRGRRYGALLLKLLVGEAGKLGIDSVLVTIHNDNIPSIRTALGNGGRIEKIENGRNYVWIKCQMI